jgi:hypothetical protein
MVPRKPREKGTVGAETRTRIEIVTLDEDALSQPTARVYGNDCICDEPLSPGK